MVVGKGVAEKKELASTVQALGAAEVPVLGYVFNFANPKKSHSKNYYYYEDTVSSKDDKESSKTKGKGKHH
jgi:Mrp family chromosome partitioning ATPase